MRIFLLHCLFVENTGFNGLRLLQWYSRLQAPPRYSRLSRSADEDMKQRVVQVSVCLFLIHCNDRFHPFSLSPKSPQRCHPCHGLHPSDISLLTSPQAMHRLHRSPHDDSLRSESLLPDTTQIPQAIHPLSQSFLLRLPEPDSHTSWINGKSLGRYIESGSVTGFCAQTTAHDIFPDRSSLSVFIY